MTWLDEDSVPLGVSFSSSRFVTIGSIGDTVNGDGVEQMFVEALSEQRFVLTPGGHFQ
jgi:hypothetical protein